MAENDDGLPAGATLVRTTPEFTAATVPAGLLRAHRVADDVWGLLKVRAGTVIYVLEDTGTAVTVDAGSQQVIEPGLLHHVDLSPDARFVVEFHRIT